jgi:hypothetical protein
VRELRSRLKYGGAPPRTAARGEKKSWLERWRSLSMLGYLGGCAEVTVGVGAGLLGTATENSLVPYADRYHCHCSCDASACYLIREAHDRGPLDTATRRGEWFHLVGGDRIIPTQ